ncbi:hypothetical protein KH400_13210 [Desertibacillus haloalkaliphilus]|nr:hypothetical protein [Desertibacillus haloalkaliphilus]
MKDKRVENHSVNVLHKADEGQSSRESQRKSPYPAESIPSTRGRAWFYGRSAKWILIPLKGRKVAPTR